MYAKTNFIKWLGFLTMTLDHMGFYLFPTVVWLRIFGRIAFPCFLYTTIQGTTHTKNYKRYIGTLLAVGTLSQVLTGTAPNVLFQLALFSLSVRYKKAFPLLLGLSFFAEYGGYGFLLGWSVYLFKQKKTGVGLGLFFLLQFFYGPSIQVFVVLFLPFIFLQKVPPLPRPPKAFGYLYYPGHMAVLKVLALLF